MYPLTTAVSVTVYTHQQRKAATDTQFWHAQFFQVERAIRLQLAAALTDDALTYAVDSAPVRYWVRHGFCDMLRRQPIPML